jgi:hypothetical protein
MREKNCQHCGIETKRHDAICPNCHWMRQQWAWQDPTVDELAVLKRSGNVCQDCGVTETKVLRVILDDGTVHGAYYKGKHDSEKLDFFAHALFHPEKVIIRCLNCQSKFKRSEGRPRQFSPDELKAHKANRAQVYRLMRKQKVLALFSPDCCVCGKKATRVLWCGGVGLGPKRGRWQYEQERLLVEPDRRLYYEPFCDYCVAKPFRERLGDAKLAKIS